MNRLLNKKYVSKSLVILLLVILTSGVLQIYASKNNNTTLVSNVAKVGSNTVKPSSLEDSVKVTKIPKKEVNIDGFSLPSEIISLITSMDKKSADKNILNFKKLIKGLDVPDEYITEFVKLMKHGHKINDSMIAYEFLYENYGCINELEVLIKNKDTGKTWAQVFKDYTKEHKEFKPTNFKPGYLEELMKDPNITADDIMNADRVSQKGLGDFDELIKSRKEGKTWKEINTKLGVVNTSEKLPRVAFTEGQVEKYKKSIGLSESQVIDALVIAGKLGEDDTTILKKVKAGNKKEDILAQYYIKKYN